MAYDKGKLSEIGSRDIMGGWAGSLLIDRNLLGQNFEASAPNLIWVSDISVLQQCQWQMYFS